MTNRRAELFSTSNADELSYRALADVSAVIAPHEHARVIGGHMVLLILAAHPTPGTVDRHTADADAGIDVQVAGSGDLHTALLDRGYRADSGNRYVKSIDTIRTADGNPGELIIDLLVPADTSRFSRQVHGGRGFDAMPGLRFGLAGNPLTIDVGVELIKGDRLEFTTRTLTVEGAVILKAIAYQSRAAAKDVVDLYNLLTVTNHHRDDIGRWRLNEPGLNGSRGDAVRILHRLADTAEARTPTVDVDGGRPRRAHPHPHRPTLTRGALGASRIQCEGSVSPRWRPSSTCRRGTRTRRASSRSISAL